MNTDRISSRIIFGHMHEDAGTERDLSRYLTNTNKDRRALVVCSGGETAATLLAEGIKKLDVIDTNQTQLNLCRLKMQICKQFESELAKRIITTECSPVHISAIEDYSMRLFADSQASYFRRGLCFSGRTDRTLYIINRYLRPFLLPDKALLNTQDIRFKTLHYFLPLIAQLLHGNLPLPNGWTEKIVERLIQYLKLHGLNDALTQSLLRSRFAGDAIIPWKTEIIEKIRMNDETEVAYINTDLTQHLRENASKYHLMALSNVCDLLNKENREILLQLAAQRLINGGILMIRSMFLTFEDFTTPHHTENISKSLLSIVENDRSILCPPVLILQKSEQTELDPIKPAMR